MKANSSELLKKANPVTKAFNSESYGKHDNLEYEELRYDRSIIWRK